MNIIQFNEALSELGFTPENTTRIEVGVANYSMLKKEFGSFANKFKGVDFLLNTTLGKDDLFIFKKT